MSLDKKEAVACRVRGKFMGDGADGDELVLVVEPEGLGDTFATGVMPPEDCGDHVRVAVFVERRTATGRLERRIVTKMVFPKRSFLEAFEVVRQTLAGRACPSLN